MECSENTEFMGPQEARRTASQSLRRLFLETTARTIVKSVSWQLMGLITMSLIGYAFTRSFSAGGGIALVGAVTGLVTFVIHEKIWNRVCWGRAQRGEPVSDQFYDIRS